MKASLRKLGDNAAQPAVEVRLTALTFSLVVLAAAITLTTCCRYAALVIVNSTHGVGGYSLPAIPPSLTPSQNGAGN